MYKNALRLNCVTKNKGYDWWWHSFTAQSLKTGEFKPFFIEYYVINPGRWKGKIEFGQLDPGRIKPCYAMIKAGCWGEGKAQLHNFFGINSFSASKKVLNCNIGNNRLSDEFLKGSVCVSHQEAEQHPEWMSDAGSIQWDLKINKEISFDVGYGSGLLSNFLNVFTMYWHVQGMLCSLEGRVFFNGEEYVVKPDTSYGYQDKNWGRDYTNPWIWLNCNNFVSEISGKKVKASLDVGGGCPKIFGIPLNRRILTAFYYKDVFQEYNFSKFWKFSKQQFHTHQDDNYFYWEVVSENSESIIEVNFRCQKNKMLLVQYENPSGIKHHNRLWNGGHAEGTIKYYIKNPEKTLIDVLKGSMGGCEYGEY